MAGKVLCPKCLVVVDEDDIGERICPRCRSRLCPNAHVVEAKICVQCGWEDPNYHLWQKRQQSSKQPSERGRSGEYRAVNSGRICPKCGIDTEPGTRRCPNCGWLFPSVSGIERAAPRAAPPTEERKAVPVQDFQKAVPREQQTVSTPRSPILAEVGAGGGRREWDFGSFRRLFRPIGAGLLVLGVLVSLVWGSYVGGKYIADRISGGDERHQPVSIQSAKGNGRTYAFAPVVVPPDGGKIVWSPEGDTFKPGTHLVLTAVPATCYAFDRWEGIESTSQEVSINFDPKKTVTAHFKLKDTVPPMITGVKVTRYSDVGATIVWRTDEPAKGEVLYGPTTEYGMVVKKGQLVTDHVVDLRGLTSGKTYYFKINSRDECGNEATAQAGSFTTMNFVARGYSVGERAPDFTLPSFKDSHPDSPNNPSSPYYIGEQVSLSQFRGRWVFLNLWSTFCAACLGEFPHIREFYEDEKWADRNSADADWAMITVCIDGRTDRIVTLEEKYKYQVGLFTFPILVDDGEKRTLTDLYRITYVPKSVFIDPDGIIRAVKVEQFKSMEEIGELVRSLSSPSEASASAR